MCFAFQTTFWNSSILSQTNCFMSATALPGKFAARTAFDNTKQSKYKLISKLIFLIFEKLLPQLSFSIYEATSCDSIATSSAKEEEVLLTSKVSVFQCLGSLDLIYAAIQHTTRRKLLELWKHQRISSSNAFGCAILVSLRQKQHIKFTLQT